MPPRKSSIHDLPENVQLVLNKELGKGKLTLDEFVALLKKQGFEISRSALGRYAQGYRKEIERMRRVQQASDMMIAEIGEAAANSKIGRAVAEMVKIVAFDHLAAREGDEGKSEADPKDLMFIARAIKDAVGAGKIELEQELAIRKAALKEAADKLSAATKDAAAAGEKGLSAERVAQLRRDFLGVKPSPADKGAAAAQ
jgi:hypothetical protein